MKDFLLKTGHHWKLLLKDKAFVISLLFGVILSFASYGVTIFVSMQMDMLSYTSVGDLILDRIPTYDLEILFTWGIYLIVFFSVLYTILWKPEMTPFVLKSFALLYFVRCGFMILTNFGPPEGFFYENGVDVQQNFMKHLIFRNDLFFSGHVSIPFLGFLIFRKSYFAWLLFVASIVMAFTVLLMHVHYSIDVFAAFFITYSVYALSDKVFNNLNLRFRERINKYGWASVKSRINQRKLKKKGGIVGDLEKVW